MDGHTVHWIGNTVERKLILIDERHARGRGGCDGTMNKWKDERIGREGIQTLKYRRWNRRDKWRHVGSDAMKMIKPCLLTRVPMMKMTSRRTRRRMELVWRMGMGLFQVVRVMVVLLITLLIMPSSQIVHIAFV